VIPFDIGLVEHNDSFDAGVILKDVRGEHGEDALTTTYVDDNKGIPDDFIVVFLVVHPLRQRMECNDRFFNLVKEARFVQQSLPTRFSGKGVAPSIQYGNDPLGQVAGIFDGKTRQESLLFQSVGRLPDVPMLTVLW
jgi:hypothetical protein